MPIRQHSNLDQNIISLLIKMKLDMVGLSDFEDMMPIELSDGMKKRVGLARALALDPKFLIYDEPTAGLDPITAGGIDQLIIDLSKKMGVTSLLVTHDAESAFRVASRLVVLHEGVVAQEGTPDDIRNTKHPVVKQFINGSPEGPIPLRQSRQQYLAELLNGEAPPY